MTNLARISAPKSLEYRYPSEREDRRVVMTFALASIALSAAQPADLPPFIRTSSPTLTFYYNSPDPALGPTMLKDLLRKENIEHPWFAKNEHVLRLIGASLGDIAVGKPKIVREYEAAFADAPPMGRRVILRALENCG